MTPLTALAEDARLLRVALSLRLTTKTAQDASPTNLSVALPMMRL